MTDERCNQCGGAFERQESEIVTLLVCESCGREIPARALPTVEDFELLALALATPSDREPTDDEIYNGPGMEGGIPYGR